MAPELPKKLVRRLCAHQILTAEQRGTLIDQGNEKLQKDFLRELAAIGELHLRYPDQPTHPE